jgi:predicted dithiol-disulfide oxidoreductase (DUF899 family)
VVEVKRRATTAGINLVQRRAKALRTRLCADARGSSDQRRLVTLDPLGLEDVRHAAKLATDPRVAKIEPFKARMGWTFRWYSSDGSDFNYDFHVTFDESVAPIVYNYRPKAEVEQTGLAISEWDQPFDLHGLSVFLRDGERVFHTYSAYARGCDNLGFVSNFLDLTPLGRQEEWEEPKGRATELGAPAGSPGVRYHDEYDT